MSPAGPRPGLARGWPGHELPIRVDRAVASLCTSVHTVWDLGLEACLPEIELWQGPLLVLASPDSDTE